MNENPKVVLLSSSPRRIELLKRICKDFEIISPNFEEKNSSNFSPKKLVIYNALGKVNSINHNPETIYISCDTVVYLKKEVLGKPGNKDACFEMLKKLSNNYHFVYSGLAVSYNGKTLKKVVKTKVLFNDLSDSMINEYIEKLEPFDKAGGYGIQDGFPLVKSTKGDFENVVGFPLNYVQVLLQKFGYKF